MSQLIELDPLPEVDTAVLAPVETAAPRRRSAGVGGLAVWIVLVALGCFAALAMPALVGQVYVADDLGEFHLPVRSFYAEQLARGEAFDWMPSLYGGFYIAAEGQLGAYHPWHWLLYRWLPLATAFNVELLSSYPLLFAGTWLLLSRLVRRRDAALLGALVFTFGGFSLLHFVHPNAIAVVAHLPWLLWAADVSLVSENRKRRAAAELAFALLVASQCLLGYPQYVWFSLLGVAAFVGWRIATGVTPYVRMAPLVVATVLGGLAGATQWLPTWHLLSQSLRQTADASFANTGSLHPLNYVQLVAPYLFQTRVAGGNTHELGLYIGAVPLLLCVWLLSQRGRWGAYRPLVLGLIVCFVASSLLALGEFGLLYRLQSYLPVVNRFRFPCRAIVLVQLCLACGAAVGAAMLFDRLNDFKRRGRRFSGGDRSLVAVVAISALVALLGPWLWPDFVASPAKNWLGPALLAAAAWLVGLTARGHRLAAGALVLLVGVDLSVYGLSYAVIGRTAPLADFVAGSPRPPVSDATPGALRVVAPDLAPGLRTGDQMLLASVTRIDGYAGLEPGKRLDYRQPIAWQLAGAEWAWLAGDGSPNKEKRAWRPVTVTAERARMLSEAFMRPRRDCTGLLTLEAACVDAPLSLPKSTPGQASMVADRPGHLTIDADCADTQLLVTTESFEPSWVATIDGHEQAVIRVNGDFLGCVVAGGKHRVELEFRPACRAWGARLSAGGLALIVACFVFRLRDRGPRRADEDLL